MNRATMLPICLLFAGACTDETDPLDDASVATSSLCSPVPTDVETTDYFLSFNVPQGLMPDPQFSGRAAQIAVHRVRPLYAKGKCPEVVNQAAVLIHGRSVPGPPVFDLRHGPAHKGELSVQEDLALAGIDTFAPSLLGFGKSTRFEALDDPHNASLPGYATPSDPTSACANPAGCDVTHNPIFGLDQQRTVLGTNPLAGQTYGHSSPYRFGGADVWVRDIRQVIDDARARAGVEQVALISYSFASQAVGRALYAPKNADIVAKISKVAFISPLFLQPNGFENPTEEPTLTNMVSFPMTLLGRTAFRSTFNMPTTPVDRNVACVGHILPDTDTELEEQTMALDDLGRTWGGTDPLAPLGVLRAPTFSSYGFNRTVAGQIQKPTLVMQGTDDLNMIINPSGKIQSCELFNALTTATNKVLVRIECASHAILAEGCDPSIARCKGTKNVTTYGSTVPGVGWLGPHKTVTTAVIEWIRSGTFTVPGQMPAANGSFLVSASGIATSEATPSCP